MDAPWDRLGVVERSLSTVVKEGEECRVLVASRRFSGSPDEVWDAMTSASRIPRWLTPVSGDLRLGGRYQLEGQAGGTILRCSPPADLGITWEFGGNVSWVDVTLTPVGEDTVLRLVHTSPVPQEMWDEYGPGAVGVGWDSMLLGLTLHLETGGGPMPPSEQATPAAAAFMAACSDAWCAASIAFGTDPTAARAAADRTTAAYTAWPTEPDGEG